ncbi:MAG: ATP-dependent helicase, partial [Proteobacteria bacterium]|nr:ATP-dependent helicase [Pseudomonadota bacterium]
MPRVFKIIGPPGTGKTEYLLRQVEQACNKYFPKDLGVVSYTVASVSEVKERIRKKLNVTYKEIPNVRTIHSHCFGLLRLKKEDVMETAKNVKAFNEDYPCHQITGGLLKKDDDDDDIEQGANDANDIIYNQVQVLRSRMIPVDEWPIECREFHDAWTTFMEENDKLDFNGMLEQCIEQGLSPEIKVLMVDEAQDLPALQTALIRQWGKACDSVLWAGDANQAIFRFAGSDPNNFINLEAEKIIPLEQSYRLSPAILAKSVEVIRQANVKEIVNFRATDKHGPGHFLLIRQPDLALPGSHMILCRCNFQVKRFVSALRRANILFANPYRKEDKGWNPLELDGTQSIKIYLRMTKGEALTIYEIKQMLKNCIAKECLEHGAKKTISELPLTDKRVYEFFGLLSMGFSDKFLDKQKPIREYFRVKSENRDLIYYLADND